MLSRLEYYSIDSTINSRPMSVASPKVWHWGHANDFLGRSKQVTTGRTFEFDRGKTNNNLRTFYRCSFR